MPTTIPVKIEDRATYYAKNVKWLNDNKTRLAIAAAKITAMNDKYGDETIPESYMGRKKAWNDSSQRKDSKITTNLQTVSDELADILINIYDNIPADAWTDDDRLTTNRKTGLPHNPTHTETPIAAKCSVVVEIQPDALFKLKVKDADVAGRAKLPERADAVEIAYAIIESKIRPVPAEMIDKVRKDCAGVNDNTMRMISHKLKFSLQLDPLYSGFDMKFWLRFINTRRPDLPGNWTESFTKRIL